MISIPDDIWRHVAQFMSQDDLRGMIGVSSMLFHLAMDARYHTVSFTFSDSEILIKLRRLKDPSIAPRIRHLHVDLTDRPLAVCQFQVRRTRPPKNIVRRMIETVSVFSGVTQFYMTWCWSNSSLEQALLPFLIAAWETFGSRLYKVSFKAGRGTLPILLSTITKALNPLQELEILGWPHDSHGNRTPKFTDTNLTTHMAQFINEVTPGIRSLSLTPHNLPLDFSLLFNALEHLPSLEKLAVRGKLSRYGLRYSHRGFNRIFSSHAATLRHVNLTIENESSNWILQEFTKWMETNQLNTSILSNLFTFTITVPSDPLAFDLAVGYIKRSADTLTSLSLLGEPLSYVQVNTVLSIFTHRRAEQRLESLRLRLSILSEELVLMLARMLPHLHTLTLSVVHVVGKPRDWDMTADTETLGLLGTQEFADSLRDREIRSWQLYFLDIKVISLPHTVDTSEDPELSTEWAVSGLRVMLMHAFAKYIPSIQEISGVDREKALRIWDSHTSAQIPGYTFKI